MNAPCKNCEKKGCGAYHSQCKKYLDFQKQNDAIKNSEHHKVEAEMFEYRRYCIKPRKGR